MFNMLHSAPDGHSMTHYLFVYGTLSRNAGHPMHQLLVRHAEFAGEGHFTGQLFRVGDYPGAMASSDRNDKVFGELYRLRSPQLVLPRLDAYEGCAPSDPLPHQFARRRLRVHLAAGKEKMAWVYLLNRVTPRFPRIASGRFVATEPENRK
jgi:gamma-glutamylcyclotransferase (GGCT)/AIG2-like uncharacterized protein YtfP